MYALSARHVGMKLMVATYHSAPLPFCVESTQHGKLRDGFAGKENANMSMTGSIYPAPQ